MISPREKIAVLLENYEVERILSDCSDYSIEELLLYLFEQGRLDFEDYFPEMEDQWEDETS